MALHARGCAVLPLSVWSVAVAALDDGSESVREAAVSLTGVLAHLYGAEPAPGAAASSTQAVVDRAFVLLCNAVNDATLRVRCRAAGLLGSFDGVDQLVLLQALSKKPPPGTATPVAQAEGSAVRSLLPFFVRQSPSASSQYTRALQWALNQQAVPGAFVHALEEEYWEVRSAALHSICEVSLRNQEFARNALDYVVDMLHDENRQAHRVDFGTVCMCRCLSHTHAQCGTPKRHSLASPYGRARSIVVACRSLGDAALSLVRGRGAHP